MSKGDATNRTNHVSLNTAERAHSGERVNCHKLPTRHSSSTTESRSPTGLRSRASPMRRFSPLRNLSPLRNRSPTRKKKESAAWRPKRHASPLPQRNAEETATKSPKATRCPTRQSPKLRDRKGRSEKKLCENDKENVRPQRQQRITNKNDSNFAALRARHASPLAQRNKTATGANSPNTPSTAATSGTSPLKPQSGKVISEKKRHGNDKENAYRQNKLEAWHRATATGTRKSFKPKRSKHVKVTTHGDGDVWMEKIVVVDKETGRTRSRFYARYARLKVWDEPPSGASVVLYAEDVKRLKQCRQSSPVMRQNLQPVPAQ